MVRSVIDMAGKSTKWDDAVSLGCGGSCCTLVTVQLSHIFALQTKKKATDIFGEQAKALKALDKPGAPLGNHVKTVSEALSAFTWVFVDVGPLGIIEAGRDSGEFYANKASVWRREGAFGDPS